MLYEPHGRPVGENIVSVRAYASKILTVANNGVCFKFSSLVFNTLFDFVGNFDNLAVVQETTQLRDNIQHLVRPRKVSGRYNHFAHFSVLKRVKE